MESTLALETVTRPIKVGFLAMELLVDGRRRLYWWKERPWHQFRDEVAPPRFDEGKSTSNLKDCAMKTVLFQDKSMGGAM